MHAAHAQSDNKEKRWIYPLVPVDVCMGICPGITTLSANLKLHDVIPLPGYELWMTFIKNVYLVPTKLDIDRFCNAVSKAITVYLHTTGRLQHTPEGWGIDITCSSLPIDIEYIASSDQIFELLRNGNRVIQDDLTPFFSAKPSQTSVENGESPLLFFKLMVSEHLSTIGVSRHHTLDCLFLGDATVFLQFMHLLSYSYEGRVHNFPRPTFKKILFPVPSSQILDYLTPSMPHFLNAGLLSNPANKNFRRLDWQVSVSQMETLCSILQDRVGATSSKISIQDCISAYIVTVINHYTTCPIRKITNAASYRNVRAPFIDPTVAGNAIVIIPTEEINERDKFNISKWALAIRKSIITELHPEKIRDRVSVTSYLMAQFLNP